MTAAQPFVYTPLPQSRARIRLIEFVPSLEDSWHIENIQIQIIEVGLREAPPYHAISYTWGGAINEQDVTVTSTKCKGRLIVRKNCADVLRQLAHFEMTGYYWIDAICINQLDEQERSHQVSLMGDIFKSADCVLACLGSHNGDSLFLAQTLCDFEDFLELRGGSTRAALDKIIGWDQSDHRLLLDCEVWLNGLPANTTLRLCKALDEFAKIAYFNRIWVLQELFLARRLVILRGMHEISLSALLFWWTNAKEQWFFKNDTDRGGHPSSPLLHSKLTTTKAGKDYVKHVAWADSKVFRSAGGSLLGKAYEELLRRTVRNIEHRTVPLQRTDVLEMCSTRLCQDRKDTIYGTLALAKWSGASVVTPEGPAGYANGTSDGELVVDYSRSTVSLAREVMLHFKHIKHLWLVICMLHISITDREIVIEIARRRRLLLDTCAASVVHLGPSVAKRQDQVRIVEGGVQLHSDSCWQLECKKHYSRNYICIHNLDQQRYAYASSNVRYGDWILPTSRHYGIVLRKQINNDGHYDIVGRIVTESNFISDATLMTAFMLWLGVDDLLVHLVHRDEQFSDSSTGLDTLNLPFCSHFNSSFAEIPGKKYRWAQQDFDVRSDSIFYTLNNEWRTKLVGT